MKEEKNVIEVGGEDYMKEFRLNATFRHLISAEFISLIGDVLFYPILLILASQSSDVKLMTGLVTLSETLPKLIIIFIVSKIGKIRNRFYALCLSYIFRSFVYIAIAFMIQKPTDILLFIVVVLNVFSDLIGGMMNHTHIDYIGEIANEHPKEEKLENHFSRMMGLLHSVQNTSQLIGVLVGGILISILLPFHIALINAGTFLLGLFIIQLSKKQFIKYDHNKHLKEENVESSLGHVKQVMRNKRLMWLIFLTGTLNVMLSLMLFFNNMYVKQLEINHSYETYLFTFMFISTLGMIIGGFIISVKPFKTCFDHIVTTVFLISSGYFILLLFHQSVFLILCAFSIMLLIGIIQPLLIGEIVGVIGTEKIAGMSVTLNAFMQLLSPIIVALMIIILHIFPVNRVTEFCAIFFMMFSVLLFILQLKRSRQEKG